MQKKIFYIADFSIPNMSAYALHVLKMCDAFSEYGLKLELLIPFKNKNYKLDRIKKEFKLKSTFEIISFYKDKINFSFLKRIHFSIKILLYIIDKEFLFIYSRSIVPSLILSFFRIKVFLEIHTKMTGFTKIFFEILNPLISKKKLKIILINKNLLKHIKIRKKNYIILEDAVDNRDFKKKKAYPEKKNTCFYSGSFVKGKGIEIIRKLAIRLPYIKFHLYGNKNTFKNFNTSNFSKNIFFKGFISYSKLTEIIHQYPILLMPYKKKVGVLINKTNVEEYFSPLKMFDYLASGKLIIASNLNVYKHILKNNFNSLLVDPDNINGWRDIIIKTINSNNLKYLGINAIKTSNRYQWKSRVKKIIKYYE